MSAPLLWFLLGLACMVAELATISFVMLFFGVGAWAAACAALCGLAASAQILVFVTLSLLTLVLLRRYLRSIFQGHRQHPPRSTAGMSTDAEAAPPHPLTGHTGHVTKALISGRPGEIEVDGSYWRAVANNDIPAGTQVRVLGASPANALQLCVEVCVPTQPADVG